MSAAVADCPTVCWCADCAPRKIEARLRETAAKALRRPVRDVCAPVFRAWNGSERGWRASVSTRDGRVHARCWATRPENAAQLLVSTLSGEG